MRNYLSAILLSAIPIGASADVQFGSYDQFQTRFGPAQVVGATPSQSLTALGAALPVELDYRWEILGAWGMEGTDHDWLLATHHHGGNMCGPGITVIRVAQGEVRMMGETGACEGIARDLRVLPDALELDIYTDGLRRAFTTYRFDAAGMAQTPGIAPVAAPPPAGPVDPAPWLGRHVSHLLRDPVHQARFLTIMSEADLAALSAHIAVGTGMERRGDWLLGAGCMAHSCNSHGAVLGIRLSDGQPRAVYWDPGSDGWPHTRVLGADVYDPTWHGWLNQHHERGL